MVSEPQTLLVSWGEDHEEASPAKPVGDGDAARVQVSPSLELRYCPAKSRRPQKIHGHREVWRCQVVSCFHKEAEAEEDGVATSSSGPSLVDFRVNPGSSLGSKLQPRQLFPRGLEWGGTRASRVRTAPRGGWCSPRRPERESGRSRPGRQGARRERRSRGRGLQVPRGLGQGWAVPERGREASRARACAVVLGSGGAGPPGCQLWPWALGRGW